MRTSPPAIPTDIGMALDPLDERSVLSDVKALGAQRDVLIELDVFADGGGLADHDAGAVIDEEGIPDLRARMNVDARQTVGVFGHDARKGRDPLSIQRSSTRSVIPAR